MKYLYILQSILLIAIVLLNIQTYHNIKKVQENARQTQQRIRIERDAASLEDTYTGDVYIKIIPHQ